MTKTVQNTEMQEGKKLMAKIPNEKKSVAIKGMHERNQKSKDGCSESSGVQKLTVPMCNNMHSKGLDQLSAAEQEGQWAEVTLL